MKLLRLLSFTTIALLLLSYKPLGTPKNNIPPLPKVFKQDTVPSASLLDVNSVPFEKYQHNYWVDSVLKAMSLEEKIGQLFMVAAYSNKDAKHRAYIDKLIKNHHIGGLIFFQGGPERQVDLVNHFQSISTTPLLIAGDWEWGLAMRLDSTIAFPRQMMLGAIRNTKLLYRMGAEIARQIRLVGGQVNFAPVVDINNNPKNPVIGSRSFGENREQVYRHAFMYMRGLQDKGVLAVAKHFPGHGDTEVDSHKDLPIIHHNRERLDSIELYPFKKLFQRGMGGVMVAHLFIPSLDSTPNTATTLSRKVSYNLLKKELGFKGLAFTDALNMKGVSRFFKPGQADLKAFLAGNDVLLFPKNVPLAIQLIKQAVQDKKVSLEDLEQRVRKILAVKYWSLAYQKTAVSKKNLIERLNSDTVKALRRMLIEQAITLVQNQQQTIPLQRLDTLKIASVSIGEKSVNSFQKTLSLYTQVQHFTIRKWAEEKEWQALKKQLKDYNLVIFSLNKSNRRPSKKFGISASSIRQLEAYAKEKAIVLDVFANPYVLNYFKHPKRFRSILISYNDWKVTQEISAQVIFGGVPAVGQLPVSIGKQFRVGEGIISEANRLKYTLPVSADVDASNLYKIDSIVQRAIQDKAFPGCQVWAARNGNVFYNKSFGHQTYQKKHPIDNESIYDLASLTKILSTTLSIMKLQEQQKIDINKTLADYLPSLKESNKANLLLSDIMAHQARLKPWVPFYLKTIKTDSLKQKWYRFKPEGRFQTMVTPTMYIDSSYKDSIIQEILNTPLRRTNRYKYSDLGFYLLKDIVEQESQQKIEQWVKNTFYNPLGANHIGFLPLKQFPLQQIVPTEKDNYFRQDTIQGTVHDMGAAMLGGVGGHAGLFSNANDVGKIMQMLLQKGYYGEHKYINSQIIKHYTDCYNCPENRRGLGFDKIEDTEEPISVCSPLVSLDSFGHSGFTGTLAWADPNNGLVFVFLSNRTFPSAENFLISKNNIRTDIHTILINALK